MLVCAFKGWNDGGQAATLAATFLRESLGAEHVVAIDPEEFYDFQETRPTVRLEDGDIRRIDWPENAVTYAELPGTGRDILILLGIEPQLRWRTFSKTVPYGTLSIRWRRVIPERVSRIAIRLSSTESCLKTLESCAR